MAMIKAGTYRFHDVLSDGEFNVEQNIRCRFDVKLLDGIVYTAYATGLAFSGYAGCLNLLLDYTVPNLPELFPFKKGDSITIYHLDAWLSYYGWDYDNFGENIQTITIIEDTEASEEFYAWFVDNAKPRSIISYNGKTIAALDGGQKATLKCRGMVMADDVVMEVADIEPPNIQPLTITEDGTYTAPEGVDGYSPVVVTAAEAERSKFWDINQNYGNRVDYSYAYAWDAYTDENFHPKYKFGNGSDLNLNGCFWGAKSLTNIPQILHSKSWTNMTNTFKNCNALVEVRFDGQIGNSISFAESSPLSKESVESVISHLYDSASGKTATFNSAVRNKFTDAEWNALIATKPNWTISLA